MSLQRIAAAASALVLGSTPLWLAPWSAARTSRPSAQDRPGVTLAQTCWTCHATSPRAKAMRTANGTSVAPHDLWRGSVHSASGIDPLWRATLAAEIAAAPEHEAAIVDTCLRCHAPVAHAIGLDDHGTGNALHALDCEDDLGAAARDGVSCTICHGILPDGLGTEATFDGHFALDTQRRLFGPHERPFAMPMRNHTGFTPSYGEQILDPGLCGSCHTLTTETLDAEGTPTGGHFLEQGPYLEWLASGFAAGDDPRTCQDCHLPTRDDEGAPIATRIAHNPGGFDFGMIEERQPFGRHEFLGGNTLLLGILSEHAEALEAPGMERHYEAALAATQEQLANRTASLDLFDASLDGGALEATVRVANRTGHKLPTGYPARRLFLTVEVLDAEGELLFVSGRVDDQGRLTAMDGEVLPEELDGGPAANHIDVVTSDSTVAQWRAEARDSDGRPTFRLLRMATYGVDDRLLPHGWSTDTDAGRATAPVGTDDDPNFVAGGDEVRIAIELPQGAAPARLTATLKYQPYAPRWLADLRADPTPELERLLDLTDDGRLPTEIVASAAVDL